MLAGTAVRAGDAADAPEWPALYDAARVDGAGRFRQIVNITLPGIVPTIVLMTTLNMGKILSGGFDQR